MKIILCIHPGISCEEYVEKLREMDWEIKVIRNQMFNRPRLITPFWNYIGHSEIKRFLGVEEK